MISLKPYIHINMSIYAEFRIAKIMRQKQNIKKTTNLYKSLSKIDMKRHSISYTVNLGSQKYSRLES